MLLRPYYNEGRKYRFSITYVIYPGELQLMMHSATQSSTLNYGDSDASNAIDGNTNPKWNEK